MVATPLVGSSSAVQGSPYASPAKEKRDALKQKLANLRTKMDGASQETILIQHDQKKLDQTAKIITEDQKEMKELAKKIEDNLTTAQLTQRTIQNDQQQLILYQQGMNALCANLTARMLNVQVDQKKAAEKVAETETKKDAIKNLALVIHSNGLVIRQNLVAASAMAESLQTKVKEIQKEQAEMEAESEEILEARDLIHEKIEELIEAQKEEGILWSDSTDASQPSSIWSFISNLAKQVANVCLQTINWVGSVLSESRVKVKEWMVSHNCSPLYDILAYQSTWLVIGLLATCAIQHSSFSSGLFARTQLGIIT